MLYSVGHPCDDEENNEGGDPLRDGEELGLYVAVTKFLDDRWCKVR